MRIPSISRRNKTKKLITYFLLMLLCAFSLFPILWVLISSFKVPSEIYTMPPRWIPSKFTLMHYFRVIINPNIQRAFLNSVIISSISTLITVFFGILSAYVFSRFRFRMRTPLYYFILMTRMLPVTILIIPLYILSVRLKLLDTFLGIIPIYVAITLPLAVWLFRGFFETIPVEIEEAAMIDGCSRLQILIKITLHLLAPGIGAVSMYVFLFSWNQFIIALVLTSSLEVRPITVALLFYMGEYSVDWGALLAVSVLMVIPTVIFFIALQGYFSKGLTEGAVIQ